MKTKLTLFFIITAIAVLLYFLYNPRIRVVIKNNSDTTVDSVIMSNGIDRVKFTKIKPQQEVRDKMYFSDEIKSDGHYYVQVFRNKKFSGQSFGYYTNGSPLSDQLEILILSDTIKATESGSSFINF